MKDRLLIDGREYSAREYARYKEAYGFVLGYIQGVDTFGWGGGYYGVYGEQTAQFFARTFALEGRDSVAVAFREFTRLNLSEQRVMATETERNADMVSASGEAAR